MTTAVWDSPADITTVELVVLLKLADQANDEGVCWPSQARMAKHCRKSREHINRTIRSLVGKGLVSVEHRSGTSSRYRLHLTCDEMSHPAHDLAEKPEAGGCDDVVTRGVTRNHRGCDDVVTGGVTTSSHRTINEPSMNRSVNQKREGRASAPPPPRADGSTKKSAGRKKAKGQGKRMVPANWQPAEQLRADLAERFPTVAMGDELERFRDYSRANDKRFKDFDAAFRNWIKRAAEFARRDGKVGPASGRRYLD